MVHLIFGSLVTTFAITTITASVLALKHFTFRRKSCFPSSPKEISNEILTSALRESGEIPSHVSVESVETESMKGGVHFKVVKAKLKYNVENIDGMYPESVIVKMIDSHKEMNFTTQLLVWLQLHFPRINFGERITELHHRLQGYTIEVSFYNRLSEIVKIPTPKCYYSYEDYFNIQYLMIMEDLSSFHNGEPLGFNLHNSKTLLKNIARLHAEFWNTESSAQGDIWNQGAYWLGNKEMQYDRSLESCFRETIENFKELFEDFNDIEEFINDLIEYEDKIHDIVHSLKPKTLIHGDFKISNLFVNEKKDKAFTIDWQWMGGGSCTTDVAYFIYTSVRIDEENLYDNPNSDKLIDNVEQNLLETYFNQLTHYISSTDYTFEEFREQYIFNVLYFFIFCIREKWCVMTNEMFMKYKKSNIDGLHLRSLEHIKRLFRKSQMFIKHVKKNYPI